MSTKKHTTSVPPEFDTSSCKQDPVIMTVETYSLVVIRSWFLGVWLMWFYLECQDGKNLCISSIEQVSIKLGVMPFLPAYANLFARLDCFGLFAAWFCGNIVSFAWNIISFRKVPCKHHFQILLPAFREKVQFTYINVSNICISQHWACQPRALCPWFQQL